MTKTAKQLITTLTPQEQEDLFAEAERIVDHILSKFENLRDKWHQARFLVRLTGKGDSDLESFVSAIKILLKIEERMGSIFEQATLALASNIARWNQLQEGLEPLAEVAAQSSAESQTLRDHVELRPIQADGNVNHTASVQREQQAIARAKVGVGAHDAGPSNDVPERIAKQPTRRSDGAIRKRRKPR